MEQGTKTIDQQERPRVMCCCKHQSKRDKQLMVDLKKLLVDLKKLLVDWKKLLVDWKK